MASPGEKAIQKEIEKAADWYAKVYRKKFEVQQRYDNVLKHYSWALISNIGGSDRLLRFGVSAATMESENFFAIRSRVYDFIKQSLIKAQTKYEPNILALKWQEPR